MEVIMVSGVVFRAQGYPEGLAGGRLDLAQEARAVVVALPVTGHRDARAIGQAKASQVQRIGRGVLAATIAARDISAGEAAEMDDLHHRLAEHRLRRRLQPVAPEPRVDSR